MPLNEIKEERGVDQFQVVSYGLKILVINDSLQNFFPVLGISISEFHFSSDMNETQKAGQTQFSSAINYYNAEAGEWEPFIETFRIHFTIMEEYVTKKKILQCELPSNFCMNITQKLVQNLSDTYKSWLKSAEEDEIDLQQEGKQAHKPHPSSSNVSRVMIPVSYSSSSQHQDDSYDEFMQSDRGGTQRRQPTTTTQQQQQRVKAISSRYAYDEFDDEEEFESNDREEEDVVTPYSICNQTNVKLLIKRLNNNSSGERRGNEGKKHNGRSDLGSLTVKGGVGSNQSKLNRVYVINPDQTIDYAVDYELQVRQQMNMYNSHQFSGQQGEFIKILFHDAANMTGGSTSTSAMSIPLGSVNLNQIGCKKHFFRDDDRHDDSEFYVYGVTQVNMKKVLTIRTQYLFVNQTFFSYDIHIRFNTSSIVKTLAPGDKFPIPNAFNKCKFQIRISPSTFAEEEKGNRLLTNVASPTKNQRQQLKQDDSISIDEVLKSGRDVPNFQAISRNWSDMLLINSLKAKLPLNKATFLKHGKTFTIIKKEASTFHDTYDIVLRPPLLLKNCLPVPILIEYEDSNCEYDRIDIQKQEEKHIFVFNLQQPVMLKILVEGFQPSLIILDCSNDKDVDIKATIYDLQGCSLDIFISTSAKVAGKKAVFYVKNMVINNTQQDLTFYYDEPSERQIKQKSLKDIVAGSQLKRKEASLRAESKFFMLTDKQEIFANLEGSVEVSNAINIFNPGCKDKFMLSKEKALYEYSYSTEIFLATKDEYVYTKITTIAPLYVIVNHSTSALQVSQSQAKASQVVIPIKGRQPFHWMDKEKDKLICIKVFEQGASDLAKEDSSSTAEFEYEWSCGFSIAEVGALTIQNRVNLKHQISNVQSKKTWDSRSRHKARYLRVERRFHRNTIFIIIEDENLEQPYYKIENFSKTFAIRYYQAGCKQSGSDLLNIGESSVYAWSDYQSQPHELEVELFNGDLNDDDSFLIPGSTHKYQLDQLNFKETLQVPTVGGEKQALYVWTFTDGFTKVIRFSDRENTIAIQGELTKSNTSNEDENSQSLQMFEIYLKQLNLSVIGNGKELLVFYLQGIQAKMVDSERDRKLEFKIGYLQLDNQSENDPIYPVLMKPKYIKPDPSISSSNHLSDLEESTDHSMRTNPNQFNYQQGVIELYLDFRKNVPNVVYFELIEYLVQTFEVKLEFSHILQISKFLSTIGSMLNKNLTWMHHVFENIEDLAPLDDQQHHANKQQAESALYDEPEFLKAAQLRLLHRELTNRKMRRGSKHSSSRQQNSQQDEENKMMGDTFNSAHTMFEKKMFFGGAPQPRLSEQVARQQTIASSLQLLRNASIKSQHKGDRGQMIVIEDTSSIGGSPKRQNSVKKQNKNYQREIIDKIRQQDNQNTQAVNQDIRVHKDNWMEEEFKVQSNRIYIKEYRASPLELEVSVMNKATADLEEDSDIFKTISSLGLVISSIDEAPIKLNALVLENVFGDQNDVIEQLKNHHTEKLKWNILKFIGASNLLGNPMNFVNALGTGVQDFFYQPRQGFIKGPLQGGLGIIKGTSSLVKNTFIGTIGSASKMASSVSKGLLVLSNDKEYIYKRDVENIKKRPKNIFQGLNLGLKSALQSVGSGIVGVVSQPIEESKKGGFMGFLKGTAKGVTGLVVKPISGTLDFFSLTTEGIKNTSKNDEELQLDKRLRLPRPFYENERTIREYDDFHAFWINQIPHLKHDLSTDNFFDACMLECTDTSWSTLFLTLNLLVIIVAEQKGSTSKKAGKSAVYVKGIYQTREIRYVEIIDESFLNIGFESCSLNLQLGDSYVAEKIRNKLEKIMKCNMK